MLADPRFGHSEKIDILLGARVHVQIIEEGLRNGASSGALIAMKTLLDWIVSEPTTCLAPKRSSLSANRQTSDDELNGLLRSFWEIEGTPTTTRLLTEEERTCEDFYQSIVSRNEKGRYVVRLPFKDNVGRIVFVSLPYVAKPRA